MASKLLTTFFLLLSFLDLVSLSDASLTPISSGVEILADSGYFSMGLTLQLANKDLHLEDWQELTIFVPSDRSFSENGQRSLLEIKYQISPTRLPGETLRNLPRDAKIPTLRSNSSLTVTNSSLSGGKFSINDVVVQDSPVFDDGSVVIYGADEFFTPPETSASSLNSTSSSSSSIPTPIPDPISSPASIPIPSSATRTSPTPNFAGSSQIPPNRTKPTNCFNIFESASRLLLSRGFVIMATFLALQLETSENSNGTTKLTVFAPIDEAIPNSIAKFSDYATIFRGHVIRRLLSWKDLQNLAWEDWIMQTALKGYEIEVSWSGDVLLLNGVPLVHPDLYVNEWIAVHGVNQMIVPQAMKTKIGEEEEEDDVHQEYSSELGDYDNLH